jgi:hypothetical protein
VVGKPYTVAQHLFGYAAQYWVDIDGSHPGVDLLRLRPSRFFNVVHHWLRQRVEDKEMLEMMLTTPIARPGFVGAKPTPTEMQNEMDDFAALYAEVQR